MYMIKLKKMRTEYSSNMIQEHYEKKKAYEIQINNLRSKIRIVAVVSHFNRCSTFGGR